MHNQGERMRGPHRCLLAFILLFVSSFAFAQDAEQDVIIFKNGHVFRGTVTDRLTPGGTVLRGVQLDEGIDGAIGLWTGCGYTRVPQSTVVKSVRVNRGIVDSMLVMTYVNPPDEWTSGERRYLTLFGGYALPSYSSHAHGTVAAAAIEGVQPPGMKARIITVLTGAELRTIGPSLLQVRGFAQAGILMFSEPGFSLTFPRT
jgi:hypothetical protein